MGPHHDLSFTKPKPGLRICENLLPHVAKEVLGQVLETDSNMVYNVTIIWYIL